MLHDRLVAHRGYRKRYPENTLLALSKAVEAGARYLETDIQFTADLHPVLYHDALMSRISGIDNAIHLLPLEEVTALTASEPERLGGTFAGEKICPLSRLVEFLVQQPAVTQFVEVKRTAAHFAGAETAFRRLAKTLAPVTERAVLISFDEDFILHAHRQGYPRLGMVLTDWDRMGYPALEEVGPEFLFCDIDKIPAGADLDGFDSKLVIYEVESPDLAMELFHRGADMVETFDIAGMLEGLSLHTL